MTQDAKNIQIVLDAAVKAGVITDLFSAGAVAGSWENITKSLEKLQAYEDAANQDTKTK